MVIAGFDILFLGKKGFSTLARAREILVRPKGRKDIPWHRLDVSKKRKKAEKEEILYRYLQKISSTKDKEKELSKKRKRKAPEKEKTVKIDFKLTDQVDKVITTGEGKKVEIRKLYFEVPKAIRFVKGDKYEPVTVQQYINAVKNEFKKVRKKYGKTQYFIRLQHQYKGLPSNIQIDPDHKGFRGFALRRQEFKNDSDINDQFDEVLSRNYPLSFSHYLRFASDSTTFDFVGFMVEVFLEEF